MKFIPGKEVIPDVGRTVYYDSRKAAVKSPLATTVLLIEGVTGVMLGNDFLSVNIDETSDWLEIKPQIYAAISDFYASGKPVILPEIQVEGENIEEDDEVVALIKEIIDTRVKPSVHEDGGDVEFIKFVDGIVWLEMRGSCAGCPSSGATLKGGIENMLMHYVPEVDGVEEWVDEERNKVSEEALTKLEEGLKQVRGAE